MNVPRLADIMTRDPVCVQSYDTLRMAIDRMRDHHCRRLPVVDNGRLVGIISDRDARLALNSPFIMRERNQDQELLDRVVVAECMTADPVTLPSDASVLEAARLMHDRKFGGIPVVDNLKLVGIVTETDLMACFIKICEG
jgi:acetoin utilization protein AcuB